MTRKVNELIFRTSEDERRNEEGILATERVDMSSLISGGAGTGKVRRMLLQFHIWYSLTNAEPPIPSTGN